MLKCGFYIIRLNREIVTRRILTIAGVLAVVVIAIAAGVVWWRLNTPPDTTDALLAWLSVRYAAGDAVLLDGEIVGDEATPDEWEAAVSAHFPNGLPTTDAPGDARRVWYVQGLEKDYARINALRDAYTLRDHFGEPTLLVELYALPPLEVGCPYENGMVFDGAEVTQDNRRLGDVIPPGETTVSLWWSVTQRPVLDYSIGVYVLDGAGALVASADGIPEMSAVVDELAPPSQTSRWRPGESYIDQRTLAIPENGATLWFGVYDAQTGERVDGCDLDERLLYKLGDIRAE